jgi:hypothetical protein
LIEFVCACNVQPVWLDGHESVRSLPTTLNVMFVGVVETALLTEIVPVVFKVFVVQTNPDVNVGKVMLLNEPT